MLTHYGECVDGPAKGLWLTSDMERLIIEFPYMEKESQNHEQQQLQTKR